MSKNTPYFNRSIYIIIAGLFFAIGLIYFETNRVDIADKVAEQIESKFELGKLEKSNHKLSIEEALARKNVKSTKGAIEKGELENIINERINESFKGNPFEPKTPELKREQLNRLDEMYASTKPAKVLLNSSGQPKAIYTTHTQAVASHDAFIEESKELLNLDTPGSSLNLTKERCIGEQCVTRYQRMAFGVPVLFSDMVLTTIDSKVTSMTGALNQPNISKEMVENSDVLSEADLLEVAQNKLLGKWQIISKTYGIYETTGGASPAYQVELRSGFRQYEMVIHAGTKTILNENDLLKHGTKASGLDLRGQRREFSASSFSGRYVLADDRFPQGAYTHVFEAEEASVFPSYVDNELVLNYEEWDLSLNTLVSSTSLDSGWNSSAISVISHFETLFNYFSDTHDYRFGDNGTNVKSVTLIVDIDYENAFNAGTIMGFGRTDNLNYADSFEVVGHELGHGIVGDLVGLRGNGWPDTLNESISDLFGVLASPQEGWGVGDDSPNTVVRSMSNPSSFGGVMDYRLYNPNQSIYTNAGISNYFFYLIAEGLTNDNLGDSIGRKSLGQILFVTLSSLSSRSEFNDLYNGLLAEAQRVHGENSTEVQAIERAAEVINYKQIADNTETTVITQNAVFDSNGRNITAFISRNYLTNSYDLYFQTFDSDNPVYYEQNVLLIASNVYNTTPAIATTVKNDVEINLTFFKMADESIRYLAIDSNLNFSTDEFFPSSFGEKINQLQFSSDFKYLAFSYSEVANQSVNSIGLYNFDNQEALSLTPKSKSFTENVEGLPFEYIDALAFDSTNRLLAFDYLICSSEDSDIIDSCAWQLGIYNIVDDSYEYPFAKLDREVSVGNPSFGKINTNYIAFDLFIDSENRSEVWIINTLEGTANSIASSVTESVTINNYTSKPTFTQDDSGLVFSVRQSDAAGDAYLFHRPVLDYQEIENDYGNYINTINSAVFPNTTSINFVDARPSLTLSTSSVEFGAITSEAQKSICMSNSTTYPIKLYSVNNELESLNLSAVPNYISGGEQYCVPILIDVMEMQIGEFSQDVRFIHDGLNSPSIITITGEKVLDNDNDGIPDATDPDDDNDGTLDDEDAFPLDSTEISDNDKDGIGNNADTDDDNDGISDELEIANGLNPLDASDADTDLDGDGVSNANEIVLGSNVNLDDQTPVFTSSVFDIQVIATGSETVVELSLPTATDVGSEVTVTSDAEDAFAVGTHIVTYTATDTAGNEAELKQTITVLPYVYLSTGQSLNDGQTITFDVTLSDTPLAYPVTADIVVSGSATSDDYALSTTRVEITEGLTQSIELSVTDDGFGEADETIELALGNVLNAGIKPQSENSIVFTITEENLPPVVTLSVVQNEVASRTVEQGASATVVVDIVDANGTDGLSVTYSGINNIEQVVNSFNSTFDPAQLNVGTYTLRVTIVDEGISQTHTVIEDVIILVKAVLPELTAADSDGDGIADNEEGLGDTDNDGVPDYLDNTPQINLQPLADSFAQADDGVLLALGAEALENGSNSLAVDATTLTKDTQYDYEEVFDFTLSGLTAGATYKLVLPLTQVIPADAVYRKLTDAGWVDFVEDANNAVYSVITTGNCPAANDSSWQSGLVEGGTCIKLSIEDGSVNDLDGLANGKVVDPSGIAVVKPAPTPTPTPAPTPSNPSTGGSSGGSSTIYFVALLMWAIYIRRIGIRVF